MLWVPIRSASCKNEKAFIWIPHLIWSHQYKLIKKKNNNKNNVWKGAQKSAKWRNLEEKSFIKKNYIKQTHLHDFGHFILCKVHKCMYFFFLNFFAFFFFLQRRKLLFLVFIPLSPNPSSTTIPTLLWIDTKPKRHFDLKYLPPPSHPFIKCSN